MLKAEHLRYTVDDLGAEETIIHDVSFAVEDGEILVVTGPNGGGKSTIAKLLMGIAQPTGGQIFLNGQDITDLSIDGHSKAGIGFAVPAAAPFQRNDGAAASELGRGARASGKSMLRPAQQRWSLCAGVSQSRG